MKQTDFHHTHMHWSIMTGQDAIDEMIEKSEREGREPTREEVREAMSGRELDIQAPEGLEDGVYDFTLKRWPEDPTPHRGIAVQAGNFLPHTTASAIWLAQVLKPEENRFEFLHIDDIRWREDHFEVLLGG